MYYGKKLSINLFDNMRKIRLFLALMSLVTALAAVAEPITELQAQSIAAQFLAGQSSRPLTLRRAAGAASTTGRPAPYYVFNAGGPSDGYVIVAGDDQAPPVLGYSDNGYFDDNDLPPAMQEMLNGYAAQIAAIQEGTMAATLSQRRAISPLVKAQWSQREPYSILLPKVNGTRVVAGCVAIAMAQVMHYWQYPASISGPIPPYVTKSNGINMPELPATSFDWSLMQNTYLTNDTLSTRSRAAAKLVLYCAQALQMDFGTGSSGAYTPDITYLLSEYFGYHSGIHTLSRSSYTTQDWEDAIYAELAENRPVILSGRKSTGGHAYVCDGYDGYGMFHINWGWNGQSNGYFLLNVLNPDLQGTGSATGAEGYILSQLAVVGIKPGTGGTRTQTLTARELKLNSYTDSRQNNNGTFSATMSVQLHNYTGKMMYGGYGWGFYRNGTLVEVINERTLSGLKPNYYMNIKSDSVSFGAGITSSTYKIMPVYRDPNSNNWEPCPGSDLNYVEATIRGNHCTFKGYGSAAISDYTVNNVTVIGTKHVNRPLDIILTLTNNGDSRNDFIYLFDSYSTNSDNTFTSIALADIEPGETGTVSFRYMPTMAGSGTLTFSLNEDGSDAIASHWLNISTAPAASLSGAMQALNITDPVNYVITDDKLSVELTITNNSRTTDYMEDISVRMYKRIYDNMGTTVQGKNQYVVIGPRQTVTLRFDLDNVIDGWDYFVKAYYYSGEEMVSLCGTPYFTMHVPYVPQHVPGDVNGDGEVSIADINCVIDVIISNRDNPAADVNDDGEINIADINKIIDYIMN